MGCRKKTVGVQEEEAFDANSNSPNQIVGLKAENANGSKVIYSNANTLLLSIYQRKIFCNTLKK